MHSKGNRVIFTCYVVVRGRITTSPTNPLRKWNVCTCLQFKMWLMWGNVLLSYDLTLTFKSVWISRAFPNSFSPENIYHKYRKHHGCDTAILSLTERLKQELDNLKVIGIVSRDLSKVFDTHPHNLIVMKSKQYQVDDKVIDLLKDYLSNRRQRVKLRNAHWTWQNTTTGIPQGSILTTNSYHMCSVQLRIKGVLLHLSRQ